jgi:hypothetical protein
MIKKVSFEELQIGDYLMLTDEQRLSTDFHIKWQRIVDINYKRMPILQTPYGFIVLRKAKSRKYLVHRLDCFEEERLFKTWLMLKHKNQPTNYIYRLRDYKQGGVITDDGYIIPCKRRW